MHKGKYGISLGNERNHLGKEQNSWWKNVVKDIKWKKNSFHPHIWIKVQFWSLYF